MTNGQLREQMWDLIYGLLSPDESQALIAHIKSDPQVARLYAEVRLQADLVGEASRVEDASLVLTVDEQSAAPQSPVHLAQKAADKPAAGKRTLLYRNQAGWLCGLAATALVVLLSVGLLWPQPDERQLEAGLTVARIETPSSLLAGLTTKVAIHTASVTGEGQPVIVELRVKDRSGEELLRQKVTTNESGSGNLEIPGSVLMPGVRLEVAAAAPAMPGESDEPNAAVKIERREAGLLLAAELPVQPEPQVEYVLWSDPIAAAGKPVQVSRWSFSAFSGKPADNGVQSAEDNLALTRGDLAGGPALAAAEPQAAAVPQLAKTEAAESASLRQLERQPAIANLDGLRRAGAADFAAKEPASPPVIAPGLPIDVEIPGELSDKRLMITANNRGVTVAAQSVERESRKAESAARRDADQPAQEKISLPVPPEADGPIDVAVFDRSQTPPQLVQQQKVYRQPTRMLQIEVQQIKERFATGEKVQLTLQVTDEAGQPAANALVGVRVWNEHEIQQAAQQPLTLADAVHATSEAEAAQVGQSLAEGEKRERADTYGLSYYAATEPSQQLADPAALARLEPIVLASNRDEILARYESRLAAAHQQRRAIQAAIGRWAIGGSLVLLILVALMALVRVPAGLRVAAPSLVVAATSLLLGLAWAGGLPRWGGQPLMLAQRTAPADDAPAPSAAASEEERLARALSEETAAAPAFGAEFESAAAKEQSAKKAAQLADQAAPPATAPQRELGLAAKDQAAAAGLGGFGRDVRGGAAPAAPRPEAGRSVRLADELAARPAEAPPPAGGGAVAAPAALYFNPQLVTDANGQATIEFQMPPVAAEYRLLIDALGNGRLGSRQQTIACGPSDNN